MAIDSNNDNNKDTGVEDKNYSDIRNNNLDFSLAEVILKSPLGKDILSNMGINNKSLLTEKDIKILDSVLKNNNFDNEFKMYIQTNVSNEDTHDEALEKYIENLETILKQSKNDSKIISAKIYKSLDELTRTEYKTLKQIKDQTLLAENTYKKIINDDGTEIVSDVLEFNKNAILGAEDLISAAMLAEQDPEAYGENMLAALKNQIGMPFQHVKSDISSVTTIAKSLFTSFIRNRPRPMIDSDPDPEFELVDDSDGHKLPQKQTKELTNNNAPLSVVNISNKPLLALPGPSDDNIPPDKQLPALPVNNTPDEQLPVVSRLIYDSLIESKSREFTNKNIALSVDKLYVDKLYIDKLYISKLLISELTVIKDNFNKIIKSLSTNFFTKKIHDSSIESKPKELTNGNVALLALPGPTLPADNTADKKSPVLSKSTHDGSTEIKDEDIRKNNNPNQTGSTEIKDEDIRKKNNANYTGVENKLAEDVKGNTNINFAKASLNNKTVTTLLHHLGLTKRHALKNEDFYKNFEKLLTTQTLNFKGKDGISGSATLEEFIKTNLYTNIKEDDSEEVKQEKAITALHNMLNGSFEEFFKDYEFASQEEREQKRKEFKENRKLLTSFYGKTLKDAATQADQTLEQIKKQTLFGETLYKDLLDEFGNVVYEKDENGNDVAVKSDVIEFNKKTIFGAENIIDSARLAAQDPEAYAKNVYAVLKGQFGMPIQHVISDVSASLSIAKALATSIINNIKDSKAYRKMRTAAIKVKDKAKEKISELTDKVKKSKTVQKIKDKGTELFSSVKKFFIGNKSSSKQPKNNKTDTKKRPSDNGESNKPDNNGSDDKPKPKGFFSKMLSDSKKLVGNLFNSNSDDKPDDTANQTSGQKNNTVKDNKKTNKDNKANDIVDDTQKIESEQEKLSIDKEQLSVLKKILAVLSNKSSTDKEENKEKTKEQPEQQEQPQEQSSSVFDMLKNFMKNPKGTARVLKGGFKAAMSGKLIRYVSLLRKRSSKTGKVIGKSGTGIMPTGSKDKNLIRHALPGPKSTLALPGPVASGVSNAPLALPGPVASTVSETTSTALSTSKKTTANVVNKGTGLLSTAGNKFGGKTLAKTLTKVGVKASTKTALKKIPFIGWLPGLAFGVERLLKGDLMGAAGEVASGIAGSFPGYGTAASLAIDGALMAKDINDELKASEQNEQLSIEEISNKPVIKDKAKALITQEKDKIGIVNNEDFKNPDDSQKKPPSFSDKVKSLSAKALPMISPTDSLIKDSILNPPQAEQPSVDADETPETEQSPDAQTLNIIVNKLTELIDLQKINNDFASRPRVATSFIETNLPDMYNI